MHAMTPARTRPTPRHRPAFTLTELMVAVLVLVGVLLGIGKIFSTTSRVSSVGQATSQVLQEAAVIEELIRSDLARLSREGPFAIRCVAVPNDINGDVLLNPSLPHDAYLRADQLVFFASGVESVQTYLVGGGLNQGGQSTIARVYYGHAFQLGDAGGPARVNGNLLDAHDPEVRATGNLIYPWTTGEIDTVFTQFAFTDSDGQDMFAASSAGPELLSPIDARRWLLARQAVALMDDDNFERDRNAKTIFLGRGGGEDGILTGRSIFRDDPEIGISPQVLQGRVDAAASQIEDLRRLITISSSGRPRTWSGSTDNQFDVIADELLVYPRAERSAPSMRRIDQALTSHVLGTACSSIRIDWTYAEGTGEVTDAVGTIITDRVEGPLVGVVIDPDFEQPWFGLSDGEFSRDEDKRGVHEYGDETWWQEATLVPAGRIERSGSFGRWPPEVKVYEVIFGYNQDEPVVELVRGIGEFQVRGDYTPWPSAIRVTMTLHDPRTTLEGGLEVQFVLDLPESPRISRP